MHIQTTVIVRFGFSSPSCLDGDIDWGDGKRSRSFVNCSPGDSGPSFRESSHVYNKAGRYTVVTSLLLSDNRKAPGTVRSIEIIVMGRENVE